MLHSLLSCSKDAIPAANTAPSNITAGSNNISYKSWLALGDSYTIGQSVETNERYPAQTASQLLSKGIHITPQYIATTGWTTANLLSAIQSQQPQGPYNIVSLLIGVNDQYQHMDTGGYRIRFTQLLQKSIQLAGNKASHVFVLSIPDYSVTPFAQGSNTAQISKEIDAFNAINKQITLGYHCQYIDITPSTREAATQPSLVASDGLHPSGAEYKKWAGQLAPLLSKAL
ncbi:SGNH/GDSL hydrolase family protein [Filimonas lacunae]|nr:SGNH/GDSL hydrolase family protein [Filimonas lacunae]BAV07824.1 lysophospholipase L1 and related esterases [Filimonas lacunae]